MKRIHIKLVKSPAGRLKNHQKCIAGLGLRKVGSCAEVEDTPSTRGLINKVNYLLKVEN